MTTITISAFLSSPKDEYNIVHTLLRLKLKFYNGDKIHLTTGGMTRSVSVLYRCGHVSLIGDIGVYSP